MAKMVRLVRSSALSHIDEYAHAATVESGARLIFVAGASPLNEDGTTMHLGDYASQTAASLDSMKLALSAAGAGIGDVVKTRVFVVSTDREELLVVWRVVRDAFGGHDVPRTLVGVAVLGYEGQLVEIEATAAIAS